MSKRDIGPIPTHVAIICDGNRRWARSRGLKVFAGHKKAVTEKAKSSRDNLNNSSEIIPKDAKDNFSLDDMSNPELRELLNKSEDNANNLNQSKHN